MAQTIRRHIGAVDSVSVSVHLDCSCSDTCADRCGHLSPPTGRWSVRRWAVGAGSHRWSGRSCASGV